MAILYHRQVVGNYHLQVWRVDMVAVEHMKAGLLVQQGDHTQLQSVQADHIRQPVVHNTLQLGTVLAPVVPGQDTEDILDEWLLCVQAEHTVLLSDFLVAPVQNIEDILADLLLHPASADLIFRNLQTSMTNILQYQNNFKNWQWWQVLMLHSCSYL